ncbi:MAG: ABC transporter ATP-binding protein [Candidatus Melainabacteria bacterium]|nr:ABC transporter ATP-binding protein [Candidatus Melainabacteria bacterium]
MVGTIALQLDALSAGFGSKAVVEGVSLAVPKGTVLGIAGANGAGKSTLLKTIARLLPPVKGKVLIDGSDLAAMPLPHLARKVAYVAQDISSSRDLTVEDMVALGRNPHQRWWQWRSETRDKAAIEQAIKATDLQELRQKSIAEVSGGERQRATIAMSLAQEPEILLLDEPTAHLDFKHQKSLLQLLLRLKSEGMTVVTCLHDLNFIAQVCDQVLCVKKSGRAPSVQLFAGSPADVLTAENLKAAFDTELRIIRDSSDPQISSVFFGL